MQRSYSNKLFSLQYLRAIAAIGVVLAHASTTLEGRQGAQVQFHAGVYGVDLFFVISGFVMFYTTAEKPTTPGQFFLRRCIRIIPIYFILTTFAYGLALFAPGLSKLFSPAPLDYLRSITFIPYFNKIYDDVRPEVQQGWTLNYEMFFYAVFGFCLWLKPKLRVWACAGVLTALVVCGIFASHGGGVYLKTYTNPIILEFTFGVIISYMFVLYEARFAKFVLLLFAIAAAATLCALSLTAPHRVLFAGVPAFAFVAGVILLERRGSLPYWSFLVLLGDASYSLYLIHTFVLSALKRVFVHVFNENQVSSQLIFMVLGSVAAIFVGILFYKTVEYPLTRRLQMMSASRKTSYSNAQLEATRQ